MIHEELTREIREGPSGPKVAAFFDVDRTLLAGFSGAAFMRERIAARHAGPTELVAGLLGGLSYALGRTGFSDLVAAQAAAFRDLPEASLEALGREAFLKHLATQIFPESRALVKAHQHCGHTVAIVSSATRYQVDPVAEELGIEHVLCTRLESRDGVLTGNLVRPTCFGRGKLGAVEDLAGRHDLDLDESYFYADSIDDLALLENVGHPRPTNPDDRLARIARKRRWPVQRFSSRGWPSLGRVVRSALAYGSVLPAASAGLAVGLLNRSTRESVNVMGPLWGDLTASLSGIDLRVEGEEHLWSHRPAVFIFNHQSYLDGLLLLKMLRRDITAVAKREFESTPLLGPLLSAAGVVFVDRADTEKAVRSLEPIVEVLQQGLSVAIAPEGTRQRTPRPGRFKKGAFRLAMQAGVPIVPIVFRNVLDALPRDALVVRPTTVEAVVLPPIETSSWTLDGLAGEIEAIRQRYVEVLEEDRTGQERSS